MAQPLCLEAKRCSRLVRYAVASLFLLSPARAWATTLLYRVWLSALEIGTYTNAISHSGDEDVIVTTRLRINVLWGVRRESSDRVARWRGGRLMTFDSSTTWSDGSQSSVHGEAQGNKFQITVPGKPTVLVPPDVFPSNPWSPDLVNASWIMAENTGLAEPGRVSGGQREIVEINHQQVSARRWVIQSEHENSVVWFDDRGIAVKFDAQVAGRTIVFTLDSEQAS